MSFLEDELALNMSLPPRSYRPGSANPQQGLSDILPEVNRTLSELDDSKARARRAAEDAKQERLLAERRAAARGPSKHAKHPHEWIKPGNMGSAAGGGTFSDEGLL